MGLILDSSGVVNIYHVPSGKIKDILVKTVTAWIWRKMIATPLNALMNTIPNDNKLT